MKKVVFVLLALLSLSFCSNAQGERRSQVFPPNTLDTATVFFIEEVSPESLVKIFEALGVNPGGKVAVKISTGEAGGNNYLKPSLIEPLVSRVNGTIVECNTAYPGKRTSTSEHMKVIESHGFNKIAPVDIMDAEGDMIIPVVDSTWIMYDKVGSHLADYDYMINLAHFK